MNREPGRALDAEIAEKVFGWTHVREDMKNWFGYCGIPPELADMLPQFKYREVPKYSTSLAAAEEVIRHYEEVGFWVQMRTPPHPGEEYYVGMSRQGIIHADWEATSPVNIAHAVCLCAMSFEEEKGK